MYTKEYQNYKRMTKMTVRFLEKDDIYPKAATTSTTTSSTPTTTILTSVPAIQQQTATATTFSAITQDPPDKLETISTAPTKAETSLTTEALIAKSQELLQTNINAAKPGTGSGKYVNWGSAHTTLAAQPWCCIGDLMYFCDKYEYRTLNRNDPYTRIVTEVKALLAGKPPFDVRTRFPGDIRSPENLWVCIGRCIGVEYHLNRILSIFRRPMEKLSADKQRILRHDFHLAINELRLDISARISEVRLYDRHVFERDFHLEWEDEPTAD